MPYAFDGDGLRMLLRERGLTTDQVAAALGISQPAITHWLSGRSLPRVGHLLALCDLLGISPGDLFGPAAALEAVAS